MANLIMIKKIYDTPEALENVVNYNIRPDKTDGYIGGVNTLANTAADCMMSVINYYKSSGKLLEHFVLSFDNTDVISLENIYLLSYKKIGTSETCSDMAPLAQLEPRPFAVPDISLQR